MLTFDLEQMDLACGSVGWICQQKAKRHYWTHRKPTQNALRKAN